MSYNELKQHGSEEFPIELYRINSAHPKYEMAFHWHSEFEIIRIISGTLKTMLNYNEITAQTGDIVFVNSETVHGAIPTNCVYDCVVFSTDMLYMPGSEYLDFIDDLLNHTVMVNEYFSAQNNDICMAANCIFNAMTTHCSGYKFDVIGSIYKFFAIILQKKLYTQKLEITNDQNGKNVLKLKKALSFIRKNYNMQITLSDMSAAAEISPKYFCGFFKRMTKQSPFEYLTDYRIERAARKLLNSDMSVTEIAYICGFNDLSYFIKTFKNAKGITPKSFRNNALKNNTDL